MTNWWFANFSVLKEILTKETVLRNYQAQKIIHHFLWFLTGVIQMICNRRSFKIWIEATKEIVSLFVYRFRNHQRKSLLLEVKIYTAGKPKSNWNKCLWTIPQKGSKIISFRWNCFSLLVSQIWISGKTKK